MVGTRNERTGEIRWAVWCTRKAPNRRDKQHQHTTNITAAPHHKNSASRKARTCLIPNKNNDTVTSVARPTPPSPVPATGGTAYCYFFVDVSKGIATKERKHIVSCSQTSRHYTNTDRSSVPLLSHTLTTLHHHRKQDLVGKIYLAFSRFGLRPAADNHREE